MQEKPRRSPTVASAADAPARTGIVTDETFLEHDTGAGHPERADRLRAIHRWLEQQKPDDWIRVAARDASAEELARVHIPEHVQRVAATAGVSHYAFDADTPVSPRSFAAARRAAGGVLALVDAVMAGTVKNGFAFVRPPGHHAERDRAMGFCLFNNVALAAAHLRVAHRIERVLVVDWDVHHGNGTQHAFYRDPSVLFLSTHQYPFYPGTGAAREVGAGEGEGFTLNLPFPAGYGDAEYVQSFLEIVEPVARRFQPQFVLVSAGFDAHRRDPLAGMEVTEAGFAKLARVLLRVARDVCGGRLVAVLEGGYDLEGLTRSVAAVVAEMSGRALDEPISPPSGAIDLALPRQIARHYWRI
jgi:acetoin utilization deacetylase AcuC-like enzyme